MITLVGPNYPSVQALREVLTASPVNGTFRLGYRKIPATEQLSLFRAAGLVTPEFTTSRAEALSWLESNIRVLGRRQTHTQGRDIVTLDDVRVRIDDRATRRSSLRWLHRDWWCKAIHPVTSEWRVHVFDGQSIARGLKVPAVPGTDTTGFAVRSRRNGWIMQHNVTPPRGLRRAGKAAVAALGRLYGAVDILQVPDGYVILEVNALPAMDNYTRLAYAGAIERYLNRS